MFGYGASRIVGINIRNTKNNISKLKQIGLLYRIGKNKGGYWKVNTKNEA
jgi:predicted HTH transcriptional regulator